MPTVPARLARRGLLAIGLLLAAHVASGCATRTSTKQVVDHYDLAMKLRSEKSWLGREVERGFDHPVSISTERLVHILDAAEVDMPKGDDSTIRERRAAIPPELVPTIAEQLGLVLQQAGPNQQISVLALRKQRQHGLFHRKFLTSFTAYVKDEQLHLLFSRIDWKTKDEQKGVTRGNRGRLPEPTPGKQQMKFSAVHNHLYQPAGAQGVAVDWSDPIFGSAVYLPGSAGGDGRRKNIIAEEAIPADEQPVNTPSARELEGLSADALRRLADLEEQRAAGAITEPEYVNQRSDILKEL
ncbi:MAG: hypothetical protein JRH16_23465 [Deltaproteobacteria bacterium]|nr:hypothetical protein [Deltaproteobacteria bacterium]